MDPKRMPKTPPTLVGIDQWDTPTQEGEALGDRLVELRRIAYAQLQTAQELADAGEWERAKGLASDILSDLAQDCMRDMVKTVMRVLVRAAIQKALEEQAHDADRRGSAERPADEHRPAGSEQGGEGADD